MHGPQLKVEYRKEIGRFIIHADDDDEIEMSEQIAFVLGQKSGKILINEPAPYLADLLGASLRYFGVYAKNS